MSKFFEHFVNSMLFFSDSQITIFKKRISNSKKSLEKRVNCSKKSLEKRDEILIYHLNNGIIKLVMITI